MAAFPLAQAPWSQIRTNNDNSFEFMIVIPEEDKLASMQTISNEVCRRKCELTQDCISTTWYSGNKTCVLGQEHELVRNFAATIVFEPIISDSVFDLYTTNNKPLVLSQNVFVGSFDVTTNTATRFLHF